MSFVLITPKWRAAAIVALLAFARPASAQVAPASPPNKQFIDDAEQVAAATAPGNELLRNKKFDEARKVFQELADTHPQGDVASKARWAIAQSYHTEGKIGMAVPSLELIVADRAGATPKLIGQALALLVKARFAMAGDFAKLKKYEAAIATLRPMVDDERSTPANVRTALQQIAQYQMVLGKRADAIATYRRLLAKPPAGEAERLGDLTALAKLDPAAIDEFDKFVTAHPVSPPGIIAAAYKKLAGMISDKAPMGDYLKLLFGGDHQGAARLAWQKALAAKQSKSGSYSIWVDAVALAVRCYDQMPGGRAANFLQWTQGKLIGPDGKPVTANPLAAFLGD